MLGCALDHRRTESEETQTSKKALLEKDDDSKEEIIANVLRPETWLC